MKECKTCERKLPLDKYRLEDGYYRGSCNQCRNRTSRYKMSKQDILNVLNQFHCSICKKETEELVMDHCHTTKKFRGALCGSCNKLLGFAYDDPKILLNSIKYLWDNLEEAN